MSTWVLVLFLVSGGEYHLHSPEMTSLKTCLAVAENAVALVNRQGNDRVYRIACLRNA